MSASFGSIELRPSSELMLMLDAIYRVTERLAAAVEALNGRAVPDVDAGSSRVAEGPINGPEPEIVAVSLPQHQTTTDTTQVAASETRMWTPERNAILRRDYPAGVSIDAILDELHALPGKVIPRDRLAIQAGKLGFNRGGAIKAAAPPPTVDLSRLSALGAVVERKAVAPDPPPETAPKPPAPQPKSRMEALMAVSRSVSPKPPADDLEPVFAGFEAVRKWAAERGVTFATWDDLPPVNSRRERLGLPRFKREFSGRGVFA